ncbi:vacuolar protein sorting-associated protein 72 homolog [Sitodiplosis mosellana]|uniref:vacuolar protein sorting-associated protein 72 homolog n=1 Tax=Sitodiplosis mosellana TaxID=263140 RepID=UPI00244471BC|nr:vacuolar protein sorting-associated protein 72 homolog [Sitodiplosis mosellana]
MAATRERRTNAGNRISNLLNEEEEEEIYKTLYGGFHETEDDNDYIELKQQDDDDDSVDSDFSIDENDELISDTEEVPERRAKQSSLKVYKDLKAPKKGQVGRPRLQPAASTAVKANKKPAATKRLKSKRMHRSSFTVLDSGKISLRHSTALKSAATQHRVKERKEAMRKRVKSYRIVDVMPTQKELLAEAETTAKENLESLERFKKMEIEKKKVRPTKRINPGPIIRYHSLSMPAIEAAKSALAQQKKRNSSSITNMNGMDIDMEIEPTTTKNDSSKSSNNEFLTSDKRVERTFVTFENDLNDEFFKKIFNKPSAKRKTDLICPLTKLPAKYIDPLTKLPYRNVQALKIIREAYYQLVETSNVPGSDEWIQWRRKIKDAANTKTE